MKRIRRKKDGEIFAWSKPLSEREDMEEFDTDELKPPELKELEALTRQELMIKAKENGIKDIHKKKNTDLILEIFNLKGILNGTV
jgi:hypothetical protein